MSCRAPTIEEKATKEKNRTLAKLKVTWVKTNARNSLPGQAFARAQNPEPSKRTEFTELRTRIDITLSHSFRALTSIEAGVN